MYVEGPPPLYISYASPEQTRQDQYHARDTRNSRRQRQKNKKVTKVNESKQYMDGGLQEEHVDYGVSMPSPQLTQQAASIGTTPMPLNCFHHVLVL